MSMWDDPPQRKKSTVDFAGFARVGAATDEPVVALEAPLKPRDARPIVEAVRKARRSMEGRKSGMFMRGGLLLRETVTQIVMRRTDFDLHDRNDLHHLLL
jgi:hypothetical protein